eukprot:jgi/Ulvmu1/7522/UM037_0066.1
MLLSPLKASSAAVRCFGSTRPEMLRKATAALVQRLTTSICVSLHNRVSRTLQRLDSAWFPAQRARALLTEHPRNAVSAKPMPAHCARWLEKDFPAHWTLHVVLWRVAGGITLLP